MRLLITLLILACSDRCFGFSLLGPFLPWQTESLGYNYGEELGGPQDLGDEYRWNVPIITYAFDQSFLDFFRDPGVVAVEQALAVFNALDPASQIDLNLQPRAVRGFNYRAQAAGLIDLKSTVMAVLIEQLGLAGAERFVWTLRDRQVVPPDTNGHGFFTNYLVIQRNFDPYTWEPSSYVNGIRYSYSIFEGSSADAVEYAPGIQGVPPFSSVSFWGSYSAEPGPEGAYLRRLSRDDVGGLRYLLHPSNLNLEELLPDVQSPDEQEIVRRALRPGIDKITFSPFLPSVDGSMTYDYWDTFMSNNVARQQLVRRVIVEPDITFAAADLGTLTNSVVPRVVLRDAPWRSQPAVPGPGVIKPPIHISFAKLGLGGLAYAEAPQINPTPQWGFFAGVNWLVRFPVGTQYELPGTIDVTSGTTNGIRTVTWRMTGVPTFQYNLETSTDLRSWSFLTNIVDTNGDFSFQFQIDSHIPQQFFRAFRRH